MEINTEFAIGDAVYIADTDSVEKQLISKIKIIDENGNYRYGFKRVSADLYFSFLNRGDGYYWEKPSVVFDNKKAATAHMRNLKVVEEEKERRRKVLQEQIDSLEEE